MSKKGWVKEPARHSLAARGVRTGVKKSARPAWDGPQKDWDLWEEKMEAANRHEYNVDLHDAYGKILKMLEDAHGEREHSDEEIRAYMEVRDFIRGTRQGLRSEVLESSKVLRRLGVTDEEYDELGEDLEERRRAD